jgi:uncharacterized membrane protein YsdA (DUF1294 family)
MRETTSGKIVVLLNFLGFSQIESLLIFWALGVSFVALVMMGVDKSSAKMRRTRISENTFGAISFLGGFSGVILGGILFHHKVSKPSFWTPVVLALLFWGILFVYVFGLMRL